MPADDLEDGRRSVDVAPSLEAKLRVDARAAAELDPVNILMVDDHVENLIALEALLEQKTYNLVRAESGSEALKHVLRDDFAVIILDVLMPGLDGFEVASTIKLRDRSR